MQKFRKSFWIAEKPSFDLANGHAEQHHIHRFGKPRASKLRCAIRVFVKIDQNYPRTKSGCTIEPVNLLFDVALASAAMNGP
jgi:hypothetical protein